MSHIMLAVVVVWAISCLAIAAANKDAFIGINATGTFVVQAPEDQQTFIDGWSFQALVDRVRKLETRYSGTSNSGDAGAGSPYCLKTWAMAEAGCHVFHVPGSNSSTGKTAVNLSFELGGGGGGGGSASAGAGQPGGPSTLSNTSSIFITADGGPGGLSAIFPGGQVASPLARATTTLARDGSGNLGNAVSLLEFSEMRGHGGAGGLAGLHYDRYTGTPGGAGGLAVGQLSVPRDSSLIACLGAGGAGGGPDTNQAASSGADGYVVFRFLDSNC